MHHLADLLAEDYDGEIPRGAGIRILDVGTGANCIYPIIGVAEYGWRFVGTEIDENAFAWASQLISRHSRFRDLVEVRRQNERRRIFDGVLNIEERFEASICNPPFHSSERTAIASAQSRLQNLSEEPDRTPGSDFGGQGTELWCDGGETGFMHRMILESAQRAKQIRWFSSLISRRGSLAAIYRDLKTAGARDVRTIPMAQGQKQSRAVAWTFSTRDEWMRGRAGKS